MHSGARETREFQFNNGKGISGHKPSYVPDLVPKQNSFTFSHWRASEPEKGGPPTPKETMNPLSEIEFRYPSRR